MVLSGGGGMGQHKHRGGWQVETADKFHLCLITINLFMCWQEEADDQKEQAQQHRACMCVCGRACTELVKALKVGKK